MHILSVFNYLSESTLPLLYFSDCSCFTYVRPFMFRVLWSQIVPSCNFGFSDFPGLHKTIDFIKLSKIGESAGKQQETSSGQSAISFVSSLGA